MSSSNKYSIEMINTILVYIYRYGNPLIYILGNLGNLFSIIIFSRKSWRKNVCVFYLNISLLLSSIYLNSTILGFTFLIGFGINLQNLNILLCKVFYFLTCFISTLFPTVLILASINRLLISTQNVQTNIYQSKRFAYCFVSISTVFWFLFNFFLLIEIRLEETKPSVFVCSSNFSKFDLNIVYYSADILFCLIIFILCVFFVRKIRRIRAIPRQQRRQIRSMTKKDFQLLRCLFLHDMIYLITNLFSVVFSVYLAVTKFQKRTLLEQTIRDFLDDLFTFFSFIYYGVSFFIFIVGSKTFRKEFKRCCCYIKCLI